MSAGNAAVRPGAGILQGTSKLLWTAFTSWHLRRERSLPFQPLEDTLNLQSRRVRSIVRWAWRTVPFYRDTMRSLGLRPEDIATAADLSRLPLVSRDQFANETERFRSTHYRDLVSLELSSAGTSGRKKTIGFDKQAMFLALAHGHRQRLVLRHFTGKATGYREAMLVRTDGLQAQIRSYYERSSWFPPRVELNRLYLPPGPDFNGTADRFLKFQPDVVRGYGSSLAALFQWAASKGVEVSHPSVVVYGGDQMTPEERAFIETTFGIPVVSTYQAGEALRIAFECERRSGFHISLDHVALRIAGPDGANLPDGDVGEVILSNLINRATVLLNYRLGDFGRLALEPCPCGRTLPLLEALKGRTDDLIVLEAGTAIHSLQFVGPMQEAPGLGRVQVVQKNFSEFEIRAVCLPGADRKQLETWLSETFRRSLGLELTVRVNFLEQIPAEASGKVKTVISEVRRFRLP